MAQILAKDRQELNFLHILMPTSFGHWQSSELLTTYTCINIKKIYTHAHIYKSINIYLFEY